MHKWPKPFVLLAISLLLLLPGPLSYAEEPAGQTAVTSKELEVDGVKGIWFEIKTARRLLTDALVCDKMLSRQQLLEQKLQLTEERAVLMQKRAEKNAQIAEQWQLAAQRQNESLSQADAWYRSPYLWLAVGVALGAGGVIGAVSAAH